MPQLDHYSSKFSKRSFPITVVCHNVTNAPNIGSLFRTCDAFGVEKLMLCGTAIPLGRKMTKTSRATEKAVNFEVAEDTIEVIQNLKGQGYRVVALEITSTSEPIHLKQFSKAQPIALLIGDENYGISEDLIALSDTIIHIDMFGQNSSMNVVQATSITLYEITKQWL